jgi:hypothetical protein
MAGRLTIMRPFITGEHTVTIPIDNKIVAQELQSMRPQIETYLRKQMQNNKINIQIELEEVNKNHRIVSRIEQYQMMEQQNPSLKKLKEMFELDLE